MKKGRMDKRSNDKRSKGQIVESFFTMFLMSLNTDIDIENQPYKYFLNGWQ